MNYCNEHKDLKFHVFNVVPVGNAFFSERDFFTAFTDFAICFFDFGDVTTLAFT